ncbi:MAG: prepilin-type N-terminal cleavage/methylation domain-containing protein [Patescibacteria group bacterium]
MKGIKNGFTVLEILVSISLFTIVILLVNSMYSLSQFSYNKGSNKSELVQNARVSLDRISRELRQSVDIITNLPETEGSAVAEIFFQDGHDVNQITYLRYHLNGTDLYRAYTAYYFEPDEDTYVSYYSRDEFGGEPEVIDLGDLIVGEYFSDLDFWGSGGLINVSLELAKAQEAFNINSSIFTRN